MAVRLNLHQALLVAVAVLCPVDAAYACTNYMGANIAEGRTAFDPSSKLIGDWSHAQIWNPVGSGKVLAVSRLQLAVAVFNHQTPFKGRGADIVVQTEPMPEPGGNTHCKDIGDDTKSAAQMRVAHLPKSRVTGVGPVIYELWPTATFNGERTVGADERKITEPFVMGSSETDREYIFDPPIRIPPGYGIAVRGALPAMYVITSWQWREVSQ
jgi:hypothetical protein